ncbi:uncharacterized protein EI90DRAFT_3019300 [Cantharellus anzutake]|uniref:uncharacterized protein n=1 Tax=Cantharellus anzutake TaxID=1750568 RepID=UPI00190308FD|nr:uncharacterized protein EI90DRAFT_3019300 [Cantharellus anzutake]KAF8324997.1 hypothetical protein EI90DRAFT_3019300 [Cantharellus anzutake]
MPIEFIKQIAEVVKYHQSIAVHRNKVAMEMKTVTQQGQKRSDESLAGPLVAPAPLVAHPFPEPPETPLHERDVEEQERLNLPSSSVPDDSASKNHQRGTQKRREGLVHPHPPCQRMDSRRQPSAQEASQTTPSATPQGTTGLAKKKGLAAILKLPPKRFFKLTAFASLPILGCKTAITVARGEDYAKDLNYFIQRSSIPNLQTFETEELQRLKSSAPEKFCEALRAPFIVKKVERGDCFSCLWCWSCRA